MMQFLERLFGPVTAASVTPEPNTPEPNSRQTEIDFKVDNILEHLDNNFPSALLEFSPYNLIDWNRSEKGRTTSPIYLGSALALRDRPFLRHVGAVLTIIDPGRCPKSAVENALRNVTDDIPKSHLYLSLDDDPRENISKYFDESAKFLAYHQNRGVPIFVHCMAGMSRSSTILANYLMKKYNINALTALDLMKKRRPIVRPNAGFVRQLVEQEKK